MNFHLGRIHLYFDSYLQTLKLKYVLFAFETWLFALRGKYRLSMCANTVLRGFELKRERESGGNRRVEETCIMREFIICTFYKVRIS